VAACDAGADVRVIRNRPVDRRLPRFPCDRRDIAGRRIRVQPRIRDRFPIGASEDSLIAYLADQKFTPEWRRRDDANATAFVWNGLLCKRTVRVFWRADAAGLLTEVGGSYQSDCL
jgi:hypothetical protein